MKYVLLTSAKFFMFKLAESLHSSGNLERIVTGYPKIMLKEENLPFEKIESHSIFQIADYGIRKLNLKSRLIKDFTSDANRLYLDKITSSRIGDSDLISMSSLSLYTARKVKSYSESKRNLIGSGKKMELARRNSLQTKHLAGIRRI